MPWSSSGNSRTGAKGEDYASSSYFFDSKRRRQRWEMNKGQPSHRQSFHFYSLSRATMLAAVVAYALVSSVTAFTATQQQQRYSQPLTHDRLIRRYEPPFTSKTIPAWLLSSLPSSFPTRSNPTLVASFGNTKQIPPFATSSKTRLFLSRASEDGSGGRSDQAEWKAILLSLQLYKAAFGDLKVPVRFVVPSMAPWPESAWGMKLGQKVGAIRNTGLYVDKNEKRRQQLESLGFIWRVRAATKSAVDSADIPFDQIYDALVAYRTEIKPSGPLTVPLDFTVPDSEPWPENTRGLPLGRSLEKLRSKAYLNKNPDAKKKLEQIGFETDKQLSANDKRFQAVYLALERYKEIYGDLLVPQPFVVPSDSPDWPQESWGLRLGARVNAIRSQGTFIKNNSEREEMLDAIGFVWNPPEEKSKRRKGRKSLEEIDAEEREAFLGASKDGDTDPVSSKSDDDFGEEELESFLSSFDFSDDESDSTDGESSLGSRTWGLETGRNLDNSVPVAARDDPKIDADEEYVAPRTLGESLAEARARALESGVIEDTDSKRAVKRKREPEIPWFNDDFGEDFVFEDVVEALTLYKKFYGDFSNITNADFVIPVRGESVLTFDDDYDFDLSVKTAAAELTRFDEIDDSSLMEDDLQEEAMSAELQDDAEVATIAPLTEVEWPEHLGGMRLGDIIMRIRDGSLEVKHLPERKAQLDAIDFDWGDPLRFIDVPFEKAMCAMYAYYLVRGDMFVPPEFVMLDEDPYPKALAGFELGKAVKRIRELQNFFEAFHPEKVYLLRMIDFVWFPTLALPIDPNEGEMTTEKLILLGTGHPAVSEVDGSKYPYQLLDQIFEEGPYYDASEDPKQWWRQYYNWEYFADVWHQRGLRDFGVFWRRRGFPIIAAEHEAKYGPGLFQQIDQYLESLPEMMEEEGLLEQSIGTAETKNFYSLVDKIKEADKKLPELTDDSVSEWRDILNGLLMEFKSKDCQLFDEKLEVRFRELETALCRNADSEVLPEASLEAKEQLYGYLEELNGCKDIPELELQALWETRLKIHMCLVMKPVFDRIDQTKRSKKRSKKKRLKKDSAKEEASPSTFDVGYEEEEVEGLDDQDESLEDDVEQYLEEETEDDADYYEMEEEEEEDLEIDEDYDDYDEDDEDT